MKGYTRCTNGHIHKENEECQWCPKSGNKDTKKTVNETQILGGIPKNPPTEKVSDKTVILSDNKPVSSAKTVKKTTSKQTVPKPSKSQDDLNRTFIKSDEKVRATRKLMGWIVTYSQDPIGEDYKIYEGRNFLGSASKCDITITGDQSISSNHALILCKKNKFWLRDEMSSNGTFLNNEELEPNESPELKDGDEFKLGYSTFKFKSAF